MKSEVQEEIESGHCCSEGILSDFCDGEFVMNHPLVQQHPYTLLLAFYFDELETSNPLGSRRGKHKLGKLHGDFSCVCCCCTCVRI